MQRKKYLPDFRTSPEAIPNIPGVYVLAVHIARPLIVKLSHRPPFTLDAGCYLYCGSARGPGGLGARIGRHMRRDKTLRWHIDRLTTAGRVVGAWIFTEGHECDLFKGLAHLPIPVDGFGSNDCRRCRSHLRYWQKAQPTLAALQELFKGEDARLKRKPQSNDV